MKIPTRFLIDLLVALVLASAMAATMPQTISFGDSGEIAAAAFTLGFSHPPGHPFYVFVGWIWTKMFNGNPGYVLNMFSLFSAVCLYLGLVKCLRSAAKLFGFEQPSWWITRLAPLLIFTMPFLWRYSTTTEVYVLQWLCLALSTDALINFVNDPKESHWGRCWIWLGLAIATHPYSLFCAAFPITYIALNPSLFKRYTILWPSIAATLTALIYATTPLIAMRSGSFQWPHESSLSGWVRYFLASDYSQRAHFGQYSDLLKEQWHYAVPQMTLQGSHWYALSGAIGLICLMIWKRKQLTRTQLAFWGPLTLLIFLPFLSSGLKDSLDLMSYFGVPLMIGLAGMGLLLVGITQGKRWQISIVSVGLILIATATVTSSWNQRYRHHAQFPLFLARSITSIVPINSIILCKDDASYFSLVYYQYCLGKRRDLNVIHLDLLKSYPSFYRSIYRRIEIPEQLPTVTTDIIAKMVEVNQARTRVFWFGDDFHIAGIPNSHRFEHLVTFQESAVNPLPFLAMYRGLKPELRAALVSDKVAQHVFNAAMERILSSHIANGDLQQARSMVEQWFDLNPNDPRATALKSELLIAEGQRDEAEQLILSVIHQQPIHSQVAKTYCALLAAKQDNQGIIDFLKDKRFLLANSGELTRTFVQSLLATGDFQRAHNTLDNHPMSDSLIPVKAEVLFKSGETQAAKDLLARRLLANPRDMAAIEQLIYFAVAEGDQAQLTKLVAILADMHPKHPLAIEYERQLMGELFKDDAP